MISSSFYGIDLFYDNGIIRVENKSEKDYVLNFLDPVNEFFGYNNKNFNIGVWSMTNPYEWDIKFSGKLEIILTSIDSLYKFYFDINNKEFVDITNSTIKVENYKIVKKNISILITAFDCVDYIDETLKMFFDISEKNEHLDLEILVGIDGCEKTLRHFSEKIYPNYVKVLYSENNYGMSLMKNSLVYHASNNKVLLFDSDDIPNNKLIDMVYDELDNNDFVYYRYYTFDDGLDYKNPDNLKKITNNFMGGTLGLNKTKFLEINGFYPWRVQSDDEFKRRLKFNDNLNYSVIEECLFFYRIRNSSLSRNKKYGKDSEIRRIYLHIMTDKTINRDFNNPQIFKYNKKLIYVQ